MSENMKSNPQGDFPEQAGAPQRMDIAVKSLAQESALFWSRSQFFLIANTGLFGLSAIAFRDPASMMQYQLWVLAFASAVGLVLTILWFRIIRTGKWWMNYFAEKVWALEAYAMGDFKVFRDCHEERRKAGVHSARAVATHTAQLFAIVWIIALAFCVITALAESKHPADEAAIRQRLATYTEARNHSDAHAEALCYTEDGDFRAFGPPSRGRAEIEKALAVSAPGYAFSLTVETIRFLDANVAIADTHVVAGPPEHKIDMLGSYVMVKQGSTWLIGAARIARTQAP